MMRIFAKQQKDAINTVTESGDRSRQNVNESSNRIFILIFPGPRVNMILSKFRPESVFFAEFLDAL